VQSSAEQNQKSNCEAHTHKLKPRAEGYLQNGFFNLARRDKAVDKNWAALSLPPDAAHGLVVDGGVPVHVELDQPRPADSAMIRENE
jgi:hypothetical protein